MSEADQAAIEFRRRLADGSYRDLYGAQVYRLVREAAEEAGVGDEIGTLRMTLARLTGELTNPEADIARIAGAIARVSGAVVQARRAERVLSGESADNLTDALATVLAELTPG